MSEAVISFQSQLSCVMETVFKAAMYEITRLVEDSFLQEVSRCKEQVEALKRRLKWSESRRKERDPARRGRCVDCGRIGSSTEDKPDGTEKCLKQESESKEDDEDSQATDEDQPSDEIEEDKSEVRRITKATQSTDAVDKFDGLLKEEVLQIPAGSNDSHHWGVGLDEAPSLPGPSKRISDQSNVDWESGFDHGAEPSHGRHPGGPSEALFQSRFGMDDLGGFDKTGYGDGNMMGMGNFDGLHDSPPHLGEDLNYVGHYDEDVGGAADGIEHQASQKGAPLNRRGAAGSSGGSPSKTNMDEELSCLLINEEGYLQDPNVLYQPQVSAGNSGNQPSIRIQDVRSQPGMNSTQNMFSPSGTYSDPLSAGERLQHPTSGRSTRRHNCNQCNMSFLDSASLKAHKQTHKAAAAAQGSPYSCNECGKTFTQACNLRVHQKVHSGQGLHLCSHCGKGFPSFSDLKAHNCGQTGDKPYCCNVCGNKFSRLWNLKLHRRIHTQEKPHRCNMCDKSFTRADILKVHQRTHTGERPYCCAMCGLSFKRLDHLKAHRRKHMTDL